jgi:hypothetical protein
MKHNIVGLVVLRLNDVCFHIHVNAPFSFCDLV